MEYPADILHHANDFVPAVVCHNAVLFAVRDADPVPYRIAIAEHQMRERLVDDEDVAAIEIRRREIPAGDDRAAERGEEAWRHMREGARAQSRDGRARGGVDLDAVLGRVHHRQPVGEGHLLDARLGAESPLPDALT